MAKLPDPVDFAIPFFVLLIIAEMIWARKNAPEKYEPRDTLNSLLLGLGSSIAGLLFGGAIVAIAYSFEKLQLIPIPFTWWAFAICFVLDDLAYYAFHRSAHRVRWFWAAHVNHHSSQHYNLSTALRQTWTGFFAVSFVFRLPLIIIGFPVEMLFFVGGLNLIYQFWIHTEAIDRMPKWFEAVMNTPSHHRVHHATNPRYLDRNYAGVFIVWDKLFGTFTPEVDGERIRYGIVKQLGGFGLLWSAFHEWIAIFQDMARAPWRHKLSYLLREPGWSHDNSRETSDGIRAKWLARQNQENERS
jgi:sterol desaturase/sphingolipid hydroxylase (fatty acid hydroxylase superfamily)